LSKKGLFLPVTEHIKVYCQTVNYSSCTLFQANGTTQLDTVVEDDQNRRSYERILGRYSLRLVQQKDPERGIQDLVDDSAFTVDLSPGGIGVQSRKQLAVDSLVDFSLHEFLTSRPLQGTGRVRWCRPADDKQLFHAGIAFVDEAVSSQIRSHLGLSVT